MVGPPVPIGIAPAPAPAVAPPAVAPAAPDVALPAPIGGAPVAAPSVQAQAPLPPELQGIQDATNAHVAAADEEGAAKAAQDDARAQAERDAAVQHQADAQEAADLRAEHAKAAQAAEDQTQQALIAARDKTIPDFWAGREGSRVSASLLVGLGGAASALLGTSKNGAADIIQGNVDSYYSRQKEQIDNLYKFAAAKGKMQDDLRMRQAGELAELQVQHGATNLAIADHINEILQASQGRVDVAAANELKGKLLEEGQKSILAGRETLARINLQSAQAVKAARWHAPGTGGGGAGSGDAALQLKQAIIDGTDDGKGGKRALNAAEIQAVGNKLGIPAEAKAGHQSIASLTKDVQFVAKSSADRDAADNKAAGFDPRQAYRENGQIVGYVPAGRGGAAAFDQNMLKYSSAIRALEALKEESKSLGGKIPKGPKLDAAVLAIASTTKANGSDRTTQHEEGTLLSGLGYVSTDAITDKLNELKLEEKEIRGQLIPPPGAGGKGSLPPGAVMGTKDGKRGYKVPGQPFVAL